MTLVTKRRVTGVMITLLTYTSVLRPLDASAQIEQSSLTTYDYNVDSQVIKVTDPLGRVTDVTYDALKRATVRTLPAPQSGTPRPVVKYGYDGLDQVTSVTDPRNLVTTYTVDGLGNQNTLDSPDTGHTSSTYDLGGNLKTSVDARGKVSTYTYDAINRLTRIDYSSGVATVFEYDGGSARISNAIGKLTGITDESSNTTFSYDIFGRISNKKQVVIVSGKATVRNVGYTYGTSGTANGKLTSIIYPSGNRVNYLYNVAGQLASLTFDPASASSGTSVPLLTGVFYTPLGAVQSWYWGNSTPNKINGYARTFDLDGRITSYTLGNAQTTGILRIVNYDAAGRILGYSHKGSIATPSPALLDQTFVYDNLDRLTANQSNSTTLGYAYDANGNRTQTTIGTITYKNVIGTSNNRLTSTTGPAPARSDLYDAAGNLTSDGTMTYTYSDRGRLSRVVNAGMTTDYLYNGLNQRVAKAGAAVATGVNYLVYDEQGHVLGEYAANGTALQETVYLGDIPVAVLGTSVSYVYADHLNTPRLITGSSDNAIVWRWDLSDPFGVQLPLDNPTNAGVFTYNLRFPGQFFDRETNNHYNYFRDYDPQTGRYIQSDPIGLNGGINTFGYVGGNPLSYSDPRGLAFAGGAIGAGIGGWVGGALTAETGPGMALGVLAGRYIGRAAGSAIEDACNSKDCPPCKTTSGRTVPIGTLGYRPLDVIPDNEVQHGRAGSHHNIFVSGQNPKNCQCFWQKQKYVLKPGELPAGAIPVEPFVN